MAPTIVRYFNKYSYFDAAFFAISIGSPLYPKLEALLFDFKNCFGISLSGSSSIDVYLGFNFNIFNKIMAE